MNVSVIIPNYNGERILEKNLPKVLESLEGYKKGNVELIISDDKSNDNSVEILNKFADENKSKKVKIQILTAKVNKGFSSNVNRGARVATGEILILLNTDVIPSGKFLDPLLVHFSNENVFAVGAMDESVEGEKIILRGRGVGVWKRGFLNHKAGKLDKKDTLWVSGGSGAFRKTMWDKLGGLDEIYNPFYWEDIDLSYRALKSGWVTIFEKESVVRHEHEKGVIKSKYKPSWVRRIVYRNQFIFSWINSDFATLISGIFWLPYHMIKAVFAGDLSFILGFMYALKRLPRIIKSRNKARKLFINTDKTVTSIT